MHVLICGLGSIGRRHLRHFRALGVSRVDAYRTGHATLTDDSMVPDSVFEDLGEALAQHPDIVVVSNPTNLHLPTALEAIRAGCHVLIEKPLAHCLEGCAHLAVEARSRGVVVSVACNLRFHPALMALREWVETGEPLGEALGARVHSGAYLPDWHPWEDYRVSYAARRAMGGGAALTCIHEIDYALWIFGPAAASVGMALGKHPLGTDVDEAVAIVIRHQGGMLSTITLSLAQKPPTRSLEITFVRGIVTCDVTTGCWTIRHADGRLTEDSPRGTYDIDQTYRDQAIAFLRAVRGDGPVPVPLEDAIAALTVGLSAQEPSPHG